MNSEMRQIVVQVNGVRIGVVLSGKQTARRTLVMLHGFTGSASGWGELLDELAQPDMRVVALDMPGHGLSEAPAEPERYTMEHCQSDIIAVLNQLGIDKETAILLGYSMGGRIALYSAFSGFFRALILESASAGLADPVEREQRQHSDERLAERIESEGIEAFIAYWERLPLFASLSRISDEKRAALHLQRLHNRPTGLANSLRGVGTGRQPPLHKRLPNLQLPVLVIAGQLDTKFCAIARDMAQRLPQAQLQIVPEAGHIAHLEQRAAFVALVKQFCHSLDE